MAASSTPAPKKKSTRKKPAGLTAKVVTIDGKAKGSVTLPKDVFGITPNEQLIGQAVRVYRNNQRAFGAHTKSRGEVRGSTRKIYRQKGTGRARHGGIRAPIFVGGGIAMGPRKRLVRLTMSKKMKLRALASALSTQLAQENIMFVDGLGKISGKTRDVAAMLSALGKERNVLIVTGQDQRPVHRGVKNIPYAEAMHVDNLHTYAVMAHGVLIIDKGAVAMIQKRFTHESDGKKAS